jgi:hypothetical protein
MRKPFLIVVALLLFASPALAQKWDAQYDGDVTPDQATPRWELDREDDSPSPNPQEVVEIPGEPGNHALHIADEARDKSEWQLESAEVKPPESIRSMEMEMRMRLVSASARGNLTMTLRDREYSVSISWYDQHLYLDTPKQPDVLAREVVDTGWHVIRVKLSRGLKGKFWIWLDDALIDAGLAQEVRNGSTLYAFGADRTDETGEMYVDYVRCRFEYAEYGSIKGILTSNLGRIDWYGDLYLYVSGYEHQSTGSGQGLLPGTYSLLGYWKLGGCVYVPNVEVRAGESTPAHLLWKVHYCTRTPDWAGYTWNKVGQSFLARDTEVLDVRYLGAGCAYSDLVSLCFKHGGPKGPQIGPERLVEPSCDVLPCHLRWHAGEVMLMPDETYFLDLYQREPYKPQGSTGVYCLDSDPYPDGSMFYHDEPQPSFDLDAAIVGQQDGYLTPMNSWPDEWGVEWHSSWGQTFTSYGDCVVAVLFQPAWDVVRHGVVEVSIHEGGPGGRQIGPTQTVFCKTASTPAFWNEGEVPVQQGQIYYVSFVEKFGMGMGMKLTRHDYDDYPYGQCYIAGEPDPDRDLCMVVITKGKLPAIEISHLEVTEIGPNEARASWETDIPARCRATFETERGEKRRTAMETLVGTRHSFPAPDLPANAACTVTAECVAPFHSYTTESTDFRTPAASAPAER